MSTKLTPMEDLVQELARRAVDELVDVLLFKSRIPHDLYVTFIDELAVELQVAIDAAQADIVRELDRQFRPASVKDKEA